jgi:hypothetical protein
MVVCPRLPVKIHDITASKAVSIARYTSILTTERFLLSIGLI